MSARQQHILYIQRRTLTGFYWWPAFIDDSGEGSAEDLLAGYPKLADEAARKVVSAPLQKDDDAAWRSEARLRQMEGLE